MSLGTPLSGPDYEWHISGTVGTTTVDLYLDMPDAYDWPRPEPARKALDPNGGPPTLIYRSDGTMPLRAGTPQFRIDGDDPEADAIWASLADVYRYRGPWALETPTEAFSFVADPTVQQWRDVNQGTARIVSFGFQEVAS